MNNFQEQLRARENEVIAAFREFFVNNGESKAAIQEFEQCLNKSTANPGHSKVKAALKYINEVRAFHKRLIENELINSDNKQIKQDFNNIKELHFDKLNSFLKKLKVNEEKETIIKNFEEKLNKINDSNEKYEEELKKLEEIEKDFKDQIDSLKEKFEKNKCQLDKEIKDFNLLEKVGKLQGDKYKNIENGLNNFLSSLSDAEKLTNLQDVSTNLQNRLYADKHLDHLKKKLSNVSVYDKLKAQAQANQDNRCGEVTEFASQAIKNGDRNEKLFNTNFNKIMAEVSKSDLVEKINTKRKSIETNRATADAAKEIQEKDRQKRLAKDADVEVKNNSCSVISPPTSLCAKAAAGQIIQQEENKDMKTIKNKIIDILNAYTTGKKNIGGFLSLFRNSRLDAVKVECAEKLIDNIRNEKDIKNIRALLIGAESQHTAYAKQHGRAVRHILGQPVGKTWAFPKAIESALDCLPKEGQHLKNLTP